jgi:hypothetical protein
MNKHSCKLGVQCNTQANDESRKQSSDHKPDWRSPHTGRVLDNNIKTDLLRNKVGAVVGPSVHGI